MATETRCSMCEKGHGACLCAGCKKYFCVKDFRSHRTGLSNEMDILVVNRNDLQEKMNKIAQTKYACNPLLVQIKEWERNTIDKVKVTAELARQHVKQILNSKRNQISTQFKVLSKELIEMKETEDFVESDLTRLHEKINQLNQDLTSLNQPPTIELHIQKSEKTAWDRLIYVEDKSTDTAEQNNSLWEGQFLNKF